MMKLFALISQLLAILMFSSILSPCYSQSKKVLITTNFGDIEVMLYDDTPIHRDAFIELVRSKHFDETLFYRVIKGFLVQGGSSDSKNALPGKLIGYGSSVSEIKAEISPNHMHKRGAFCAPRQPESVNILKKSDVSQFYISTGRIYTVGQLDTLELYHNRPIRNKLLNKYYVPYKDSLAILKISDRAEYERRLTDIKAKVELEYNINNPLKINDLQRKEYTTVGGNPNLDGSYTVFGEVVRGMEVVDKIEGLKIDKNDRPIRDVKMQIRVINE